MIIRINAGYETTTDRSGNIYIKTSEKNPEEVQIALYDTDDIDKIDRTAYEDEMTVYVDFQKDALVASHPKRSRES